MSDSTDVKVARIDERLTMMMEGMARDRETQQGLREWMQSMDNRLMQLDGRTANVERSLAASAPTIDEFVKVKNQALGAGMAGKFLWAALGIGIAMASNIRELILGWLTKGG